MSQKKSKQRALVTGGTGFVGSHLVNHLLKHRWAVQLVVRGTLNIDPLWSTTESNLIIHRFNGTTKQLIDIVHLSKPDVVFHLAAQSIVKHTSDQIQSLIEANILFGTQLLEAMVQNQVKYLINTGSYWQHF